VVTFLAQMIDLRGRPAAIRCNNGCTANTLSSAHRRLVVPAFFKISRFNLALASSRRCGLFVRLDGKLTSQLEPAK
jgi:hypothetical protein